MRRNVKALLAIVAIGATVVALHTKCKSTRLAKSERSKINGYSKVSKYLTEGQDCMLDWECPHKCSGSITCKMLRMLCAIENTRCDRFISAESIGHCMQHTHVLRVIEANCTYTLCYCDDIDSLTIRKSRTK